MPITIYNVGTMYYYFVWVRSSKYHSKTPLTYSFNEKLASGTIVEVELQKEKVNGFISGISSKPRFKTKELNRVYDLPPLSQNSIKLASWIIKFYPAPLGNVVQQFLPQSIRDNEITQVIKSDTSIDQKGLPKLNKEQLNAFETMMEPDTYLLHGKTGSGKTRVYIEMAIKAFEDGKSSIILTPEISLTTQLYDNFKKVFKNSVVLVHSKQTPKERRETWIRCLTSDKPLVIVGPRSALFSPLKKIGLIVIDESHEAAYKQDQSPYYQTGRVASYISSLNRSTLILGSATPSISDYYLAQTKNKKIIKMDELASLKVSTKSELDIVDIKSRDEFVISNILSDKLIDSIKKSLSKREQSLLYLNRRGTSRLVVCNNCGWESLCPNCNLPLTYHGDSHQLMCHTCGFLDRNIPSICPVCDNDSIIFKTIGTKAVVDELKRIFVSAKISRFDSDNSKSDSIENLYKEIKSGEIDIIVGTQLLAKGLDLPKLSTLGILQADTNLYLPDFSSSERTYQLITQVLGRINRGHVSGRAVIQTYNPDSALIKQAVDQNYNDFFEQEIEDRKKFKFPPFYNLLILSCRRSSSKSSENTALKLKVQLENSDLKILVEGPAPAFHEKIMGKFQWQIVVKSTERSNLVEVISNLPSGWTYNLDPNNLL